MPPAMRIALVTPFPPGGDAICEYGYNLARGLAARPDVAQVVILADRRLSLAHETTLGPKIVIERVWHNSSGFSLVRLAGALLRHQPDAVLFNLSAKGRCRRGLGNLVALSLPALCRFFGLPSGVITHDLGVPDASRGGTGPRLARALDVLRTRLLLGATYTSVALRRPYRKLRERFPHARLDLIEHGFVEQDPLPALAMTDRPMGIAAVGQFGRLQRLETLLTAFDTLRASRRFARLTLTIAGEDDPETPGYLSEIARQRCADPSIRFQSRPSPSEVTSLLAEARVAVSDYRGPAELTAQIQRIASQSSVPLCAATAEALEYLGEEGFVCKTFRPGDPADLAIVLAASLSDPADAERLAERNLSQLRRTPFLMVVDAHIERLRQPESEPSLSRRRSGVGRASV